MERTALLNTHQGKDLMGTFIVDLPFVLSLKKFVIISLYIMIKEL